MKNVILTKSYLATAVAIAGYLIVKASASGNTVEIATANTENLIGAADSMGCVASGMLDVGRVGIGEVKLGGTVKFGDPLTSNGDAEAIKALPANSTQVRIIGYAEADGVDGDIIPYLIAPGSLSKASA